MGVEKKARFPEVEHVVAIPTPPRELRFRFVGSSTLPARGRVKRGIMKLLAIDTASTLCAACVYDTERSAELGRAVLDIGKGHAEHLMSVVERALAESKLAFSDLGAIGVSIGPGSFTGVRVGVSAARGFALALGIPSIGVTSLEAVASAARDEFGAVTVMSAFDAGRDEIHAAIYDAAGMPINEPAIITLQNAIEWSEVFEPVLVGSAANRIAAAASRHVRVGSTAATAEIAIYARLAAAKGGVAEKPRPLYLRQADAKPQAGFVLPRRGA